MERDKEEETKSRPFCCRCKEDFPVGVEPSMWRMGTLTKLKKAPKRIRDMFPNWVDSEIHGEGYLCGNCYFDLTD